MSAEVSGAARAVRDVPISLAWAGVALVTVSGAFAAWLESLLVPYYVGSVVVPFCIVFALASNWFLPRLARALIPSVVAAALPFAAWLAVVLFVSASSRPEGDVILPGGGAVEYVGYGLMLAGALVGTISIVTSTPGPERTPTR